MITVNIYYKGENAKAFAEDMIYYGVVDQIRAQEGNIRYEYYLPMDESDCVLLVDSWENQEALDKHHQSAAMKKVIELKEKYNLTMEVERFINDEIPESDKVYIK